MKTSLSSPVHNLAQRIHKTKCKDSDSFLEYKRTWRRIKKEIQEYV